MMNSFDAQKMISRFRGDAIVIATMTANFEWPQVSTSPDLDLMFTGAMGKASSVGLGLALARPDKKVIVLDGDGSLLMSLGALVTIAHMAPPNFIHFVFENRVYRTSGGQPVPGAGKVSFTGLAKASGYHHAHDFAELGALEKSLKKIMNEAGPTLVCLKTESSCERPPYPLTTTSQILERFREALERN
jgi:phosphonopyruvate decarboxylase